MERTIKFYNFLLGCTANLNNEIYNYLPLLLNPKRTGSDDAFILPIDNTGTLSFKSKEVIEIQCPGGSISIGNVTEEVSIATATCSTSNKFKILNKSVPLMDIKCTKYPKHVAFYTGNSCFKNYKEISIGFPLENDEFLNQITICFDPIEQNTLLSSYLLSRAIGGYQVNYPRPDFIEGDFYQLDGDKVNTVYTRNVQRETIDDVLGLDVDDDTYIHKSDDYYLARGHLTAKTDFIYGSQQRSTFYYVNVAPQWQTLNAGNWNTMEQNVRDLASNRNLDLIIHTGTYGTSTLPSADGEDEIYIYLHYNENYEGVIPVPDLFWKVVYEPISKRGIVLVAINNPYYENLEEYIICNDVCEEVDWLTWKRDNLKQGYGYCCDVDEFRKTVSYIPKFQVKGLLV